MFCLSYLYWLWVNRCHFATRRRSLIVVGRANKTLFNVWLCNNVAAALSLGLPMGDAFGQMLTERRRRHKKKKIQIFNTFGLAKVSQQFWNIIFASHDFGGNRSRVVEEVFKHFTLLRIRKMTAFCSTQSTINATATCVNSDSLHSEKYS